MLTEISLHRPRACYFLYPALTTPLQPQSSTIYMRAKCRYFGDTAVPSSFPPVNNTPFELKTNLTITEVDGVDMNKDGTSSFIVTALDECDPFGAGSATVAADGGVLA